MTLKLETIGYTISQYQEQGAAKMPVLTKEDFDANVKALDKAIEQAKMIFETLKQSPLKQNHHVSSRSYITTLISEKADNLSETKVL